MHITVVTIKCVQIGTLAYPDSQCTGGGLVSSRRRVVFLRGFLRIRLITSEDAHDLPSFCDELSIGVREIRALALVVGVVSASGLFAEGTGN